MTVFRGIAFDDWIKLFMQVRLDVPHVPASLILCQYAFLLTRKGQYELAEEVLVHLLVSKAAIGKKQDTLRFALIGRILWAPLPLPITYVF